MSKYIPLNDIEIYQLSRTLSRTGWEMYQKLHWQDRKIPGDQFITATDSVGANFTERYFRHHYLDKAKFCYQARGSLGEATEYWLELLYERDKISQQQYETYRRTSDTIALKLNNFIKSIHQSRKTQK